MTGVPGASIAGRCRPSRARRRRSRRRSSGTSPRSRRASTTWRHYEELEKVARYIETTLASIGYAVGRQEFSTDGKPVRNIDATIEPPAEIRPRGDRGRRPLRQRARHAGRQRQRQRHGRGASNWRGCCATSTARPASASASCCSSTKSRPISDRSHGQPALCAGTRRNAASASSAMYSLETIGFYSSEPGSQNYPAPFGLIFPDRGDFVAFVGMLGSRPLLQETMRSFRSHTSFPTHRRRGAGLHSGHRLVGPLGFRRAGLSGA